MRTKVFALVLLLVQLWGGGMSLEAQDAKRRATRRTTPPKTEAQQAKQDDKQAKADKKLSAYERFFEDKRHETSKSSLMTLHKMDGKVYIEMERKQLGTDMLLGMTISSVSNPRLGMIGFKNSNPIHTRFVQRDSVIVLEVVNTTLEYDAEDKTMARAVAQSYRDLSFLSFPISAKSEDGKRIIFDVSSFFLKENRFFPAVSPLGSFRVNTSVKDDLTLIKGVKAFEESASIQIERSYSATISSGTQTLKNYPVTLGLNFTMLRLPRERMTPRLADTRIGFFQVGKEAAFDGLMSSVDFIKRWRLEPADPQAYAQGKLTRPKRPIVYYLDPNFPPLWREAIAEGVRRWNKAFERAGFVDAIEARDFPTKAEDPEFDPDNIKYSCIRYIPVAIENAMGPSWVDPRTGEIINASILVYSDISKTANTWRFAQTAQLDERVRSKKMPDEIIRETLAYVVGHEVGHTLGLMHNMSASAAFATDSLRSASFTQRYGTTPSIMDYARFNYVAQPEDKGVALAPPALGVYDLYAIEWGYRAFPALRGDWRAEGRELAKMLDRHEGDKRYRYGTQQFAPARFDPTAVEEDLGDDPIKGAEYGMRNLKYILSHIEDWIKDDEDSSHKRTLYQEIAGQAYRYASFVFATVPGIELHQTREESALPRYRVLPRERQRAAALWMLRAARDFEDLANKSLESKLPAGGGRPFSFIADDVRAMSLLNAGQLGLSYYLDSLSYSPLEYLEDCYQFVWEKTLTGGEDLSEGELKHQQLYVSYVMSVAPAAAQVQLVNAIGAQWAEGTYDPQQRWQALQQAMRPEAEDWGSWSDGHSGHLCAVHAQHDAVSELSLNPTAALNFGRRYGQPDDIWLNSINRTKDYVFHYLLKTKALLEQAVERTKDEKLRTHYAYQLHRIKTTMAKP